MALVPLSNEEIESADDVPLALEPVYPFNRPGESILLYEGPLAEISGQEVSGAITLGGPGKISLDWSLDHDPNLSQFFGSLDDIELDIRHQSGRRTVTAQRRSFTSGWLGQVVLGADNALLDRIIVHWLNLPDACSPIWIKFPDGSQGNARWQAEIGEWQLTLDRRTDHREVWDEATRIQRDVITHVMEIRRLDGGTFTPAQSEPLLGCLQFGLSFALGRWVPPAIPVGFRNEDRLWETWAPWHCDPPAGGMAWWYDQSGRDLTSFLRCLLPAFEDPDRVFTTQMLLSSAVLSVREGFVEQRIMTAFSALELLAWSELVLSGKTSKTKYDDLSAEAKLGQLVHAATIDPNIDGASLPVLRQFATVEAGSGSAWDGPTAVTRVRNRITHPVNPQRRVYHLKGLVTDTWLLTRHYLVLLILHSLGYEGNYQKHLGPGGWKGDTAPVPWASPGAEEVGS